MRFRLTAYSSSASKVLRSGIPLLNRPAKAQKFLPRLPKSPFAGSQTSLTPYPLHRTHHTPHQRRWGVMSSLLLICPPSRSAPPHCPMRLPGQRQRQGGLQHPRHIPMLPPSVGYEEVSVSVFRGGRLRQPRPQWLWPGREEQVSKSGDAGVEERRKLTMRRRLDVVSSCHSHSLARARVRVHPLTRCIADAVSRVCIRAPVP